MSYFFKRLFKYKEKGQKVAAQRHQKLIELSNATYDLIRTMSEKNALLFDQMHQLQARQDQLLNEIVVLRNIVTASTDITILPKAHGDLRLIQQAGLVLLKKVDRICRENNLTYWMDFGSLLGAVRHKGYIPWDDDLDISMLREDYDRLLSLLDKELTQDGYHYSTGDIIRIFYKSIPETV